MSVVEIAISGMSCEHCVAALRAALGALPGVVRADVQLGAARVEHDPAACGAAALVAAIQSNGYAVAGLRRIVDAASPP